MSRMGSKQELTKGETIRGSLIIRVISALRGQNSLFPFLHFVLLAFFRGELSPCNPWLAIWISSLYLLLWLFSPNYLPLAKTGELYEF